MNSILPEWDFNGLLPVADPKDRRQEICSPYPISLDELVDRFGITLMRRKLLLNLFDYRKALYDAGVSGGFQWINGSFVENVENRRGRGPADIDIFTVYAVPHVLKTENLEKNFPHLFNREQVRDRYLVDSLGAWPVDIQPNTFLVKKFLELYNIFSYTRKGVKKGFVQIPLCKYDRKEPALRSRLKKSICKENAS